ncbi:nucleoporin, putative [Acanthamoeba castellanii str. Neff]|uniref:Nuclear pore complex protein n=1 Tax=Acanthamoeba castellanii (strain ATCC 30010 / Neff) TaxID=1257118 RepID=L8GSL4_ACACF|nr:nucleoporin, putative [Acanthamoeba castellanii str. Neff]ELR16189.1 nucleoporin, putative [Acanthamoeba castellanii str. Neff]
MESWPSSFAVPPIQSLYDEDEGENEGVPYFQHEWEGVDENYGDEEEPEGKFYLEEIDDRFNAMDEATSSYGGNVLGRAMPDAFNQFALSGFRGRVDRAAVMPAETTPARVLEAVSGGAERPEEVEFARAVEEHLQTDVFALLERCEAICAARLEDLQHLVRSEAGITVASSLEVMRANHDFQHLKGERDTWLLLHALYKDRLLGTSAADDIIEDGKERLRVLTISQKQIKQDLKERSRAFREAKVVAGWLEQLAKLSGVPTWSNTLRSLQGDKNRRGPFHQELVSNLDPDATTRQDKKLREEDAEDEQRLLQVVWSLLRAGAKKEALEFCRQSGQNWRAASLSTALSSEPLPLTDDGTQSAYHMWQQACRAISNEVERFSKHERAIYALMCGNVDQILPVCYTWEDNVWANFKGLLHELLEVELQLRNPRSPPTVEPLGEEHLAARITQIFDQLLKSDMLPIRQAVHEPYHIIQTYLILNKEDSLLGDLATWVWPKEGTPGSPAVLIKFAAHLALFLRQVRGACPHADHLIEAYVRHLIKTKQTALVALYTAKLPAEDQVEIYANFLRDITQREERERCLELADRAGLNVNAVTKRVVELMRASPGLALEAASGLGESPLTAKSRTITPEDEVAIRAIEWLTFDPDQRIDALIHANALARKFIAADKEGALDRLLKALPRDSVGVVKRRWSVKKLAGEENVVREFACYEYLHRARTAYNEWATHGARHPKAPEGPPLASAPASTQIVYGNQMKAYAEDLRKWQLDAWNLAEAAMHALYAVLLFPNGWLQDLDTSRPLSLDAQALARSHEMEELRCKVLPEIFFMCHTVLYENKQFQDSVELADLLADEYHKFYRAFTQEQLQQFLGLVRKSALQVIDEQQDALAY